MTEPLVATTPGSSSANPVIRIAIFVCFLNTGVSTRGLEIAKALRLQRDDKVDIRFFSWRGPDSITYEHIAKKAGYELIHYESDVDERAWNHILAIEHGRAGWSDQKERFIATMRGAVQALQDFQPDVVVHGVIPDAPVAASILGIPNVMFSPIPSWDAQWMQLRFCKDIPDSQSTWWTSMIPLFLRQAWTRHLYRRSQTAKPILYEAATQCGWTPADKESNSVYQAADCYLLADLPGNYQSDDLGSNVKVIGPLFANSASLGQAEALPTAIQERLQGTAQKVFVTMGSTGGKGFITEAVKALCLGNLSEIVAFAPCRCTEQDIHEALAKEDIVLSENVFLTEDFLPADTISARVDCVIGHGGQGTVQCALAAGKPLLGVAMQLEQQINLENYVGRSGAGICIPKRQWKANLILVNILELLNDSSYTKAAARMQEDIQLHRSNSAKEAVTLILQLASEQVKNDNEE